MKKEKYFRTELEIVYFQAEDVIATSRDIIEESVVENGGGSLVDP